MDNILIYKITNNISGKIYIGQTKNIKERWQKHKYWAKVGRGNSPIHKAIKSIGDENFSITILFDGLNRYEANNKEIEMISFYKSNNRDFGYNVTIGGLGHKGVFGDKHPMYGKKRNDLSEFNKSRTGIKLSEDHKKKIVPIGRVLSEETKLKMSLSRKLAWETGKYKNVNFKTTD